MTFSYDAGTSTPTLAGLVEFNGIRINDGTFRSDDLGGLLDTPDVRADVTLFASDNGGFNGPAFYAPRDIVLTGWAKTPVSDDIFAATDYLRGKFALGDGSLRTLVCKQRGWATKRQCDVRINGRLSFTEPEILNKKSSIRNFSIPLIAPDPLLYDVTAKTATVPIDGTSVAVTNAGTVPTPFLVRFNGRWDTEVTLTCVETGEVIDYVNGAILGAWIEVDTHAGIRTVISNIGVNHYFNQGTWTLMTLPVGTSHLTAVATGATTGSPVATVTWRDAWV